jgi:hypothetical protein
MYLSFSQPFRTKLPSLKLDGRIIFGHSVRLSMQHFSSRDISDYGYRFVLQFFKGKVLYTGYLLNCCWPYKIITFVSR